MEWLPKRANGKPTPRGGIRVLTSPDDAQSST